MFCQHDATKYLRKKLPINASWFSVDLIQEILQLITDLHLYSKANVPIFVDKCNNAQLNFAYSPIWIQNLV